MSANATLSSGGGRVKCELQKVYPPPPSAAAPFSASGSVVAPAASRIAYTPRRLTSALPVPLRVFPGAQDTSRAVDYIRGWRELTMIRRTVDEEVFSKQNVEVLDIAEVLNRATTEA